MKNIESNKRIDVIKTNTTPVATFKQEDKGVLVLELFRNGAPFDITGQTITLGAYRPNRTVVEQIDGFNINNNILTINFKNSIFALSGLVELDLQLTDSEGEMTTSSFYIKVNKKVLGDDNLNASDEFNSLKQLKIDLTALNEKASRDENTRITNERARESAEIERKNFYNNTAKPLVENLKDYDSQITENTNQIDNAKVGFDGKEHSSLKHRLDADFTEVKEQFNANSYLPFEGDNVIIENSLDGITKDMEIRGRTLQNLFSTNDIIVDGGFNIENNYINVPSVPNNVGVICQYKKPPVKDNTAYILVVDVISNTLNDVTSLRLLRPESYDGQGFTLPSGFTTGIIKHKFTTNKLNATGWDQNYANIFIQKPNITGSIKFSMMILEDTGVEVPVYFEGIKSVGDKSKNLFNKNNVTLGYINDTNGVFQEIGTDKYASDYICIKGMSNLYLNTSVARWIAFYTKDKVYISGSSGISNLTVPSDAYYIRITVQVADVDWAQLEEDTKFTGYEPYHEGHKISILSHGKNMVEFLEVGGIYGSNGGDYNSKAYLRSNYINLVNIDILGIVNNIDDIDISTNLIYFYDTNKNGISYKSLGGNATVNVPKGTAYCRVELKSLSAVDISSKVNRQKLMVAKGIRTETPYEPYKSDKKEILLPIENGLKGLPDGTCDRIFERDGKVLLEKNIHKYVFNGSESWVQAHYSSASLILQLNVSENLKGVTLGHSKSFISNYNIRADERWNIYDWKDLSPMAFNTSTQKGKIEILISKEKLTTIDGIDTFKNMIRNNNMDLYLPLSKPIITELPISTIEFRTYLERTHFMSLNKISPMASFKAPVDVPATISTLRSKNDGLEQDNKKLKEEVNTKTLKLHGQDVELTNSDLDLDFRIFELEMNIGLPINLNMKGMRNMARSPFEMMKILILNNNYDREDIEYKAKRYLQGGRMTQAEYDEIISLMDANELVK